MNRQPRFIFLLTRFQKRLQHWINQHTNGASAAQGGVLFLLEQQDNLLMGQLAQQLDLAPSAVSGLVERMHKAGLVERGPCPEDGRAQRVQLTELGRAQLPPLRARTQQLNALLCEGFSTEELATVERWLQQAHARLSITNNA